MESLWETAMYPWLAATGALVALIFTWFNAREEARSRASAPTATTGRTHRDRRVT